MTKHPRRFFSRQGIFVILNLNVNKNNVIESELSINLYAVVDTFYFVIYVITWIRQSMTLVCISEAVALNPRLSVVRERINTFCGVASMLVNFF